MSTAGGGGAGGEISIGSAERVPDVKTFWERYPAVESRGVPKHAALRAALSAAINDGFWERGSKLPTEAELAASSPYSLGTIQRALRDLVEQGMIERRRRRGTYVPDHRRQLDSPWHCRFLDGDGTSFLPVFTTVIGRSVTERQGPWSHPLEHQGEKVVRIDRRMEINSEFTVYSKFFALADRFPRFLDTSFEDLSGANLKVLIIRAVGSPLTTMKEQLRMVQLPRDVCQEIGVPVGTNGLHIQATAYASERPVYYQQLYVPPTERHLYLDSHMHTNW